MTTLEYLKNPITFCISTLCKTCYFNNTFTDGQYWYCSHFNKHKKKKKYKIR